jgi:hypothetical protein
LRLPRLKVIVHSGEALFHRVYHFVELAGVDVIIVHRLLKNTVAADHYLLLTEAARRDVEFADPIELRAGSETYDDIGQLNTLVYLPDGQSAVAPADTSFSTRFGNSWRLFGALWFAPFLLKSRLARTTSDVSGAGRAGFAVLTALLTPIYLPVGTIVVLFHAMRNPANLHRHVHKPDGSCCRGH